MFSTAENVLGPTEQPKSAMQKVLGELMGFYFVNIIHSNMLLLCVLIFIIGLINMNFSCKGAFGAL